MSGSSVPVLSRPREECESMHEVNSAAQANPRIVVLIPCLNEEATIGKVVRDFQHELPDAQIYVIDNASMDRTAEEATSAGALVLRETRRGKGFVVQTMFQKVDADIYVLVDGDDTYPAERVHDLIAPIVRGEADMVVGSRLARRTNSEFRPMNRLGNQLYLHLINLIFRTSLTDILSGLRAANRRLVKEVPLVVSGFDIEAELTIKALERGYRISEIPVDLRSRPEGSFSKIHKLRDGWQILRTILALFRDYEPFTFFGAPAVLLMILAGVLGLGPVKEMAATGSLLRLPSLVLSAGLFVLGMLSLVVGLVLHTINRRFREMEYYLRLLFKQ